MKTIGIAFLFVLSPHLWSQEAPHDELLPKNAEARFQSHAVALYHAASNIEADLQLSIQDERLLLHLRHRGFPHLASLIYNDQLYTFGGSTLFSPDYKLKTCSREEGVVEELLARTLLARLAANSYASFQILKDLAPTPEAMKFEAQAKNLADKIFAYKPNPPYDPTYDPTEAEFLQSLESIRILFDKLATLPKLTAQQLADERAEVAVLAPQECEEPGIGFPVSAKKWVEREVKWHQQWNHQGFFLAFSIISGSDDYMQLKTVVNLKGGVFEWNQPYSGSHFGPDSYESKLNKGDFQSLKDFVQNLPSPDAPGEKNRFVVSFVRDGSWVTRIYNSLPAGDPLEDILKRMLRQGQIEWMGNDPEGDVFRKELPGDGTLR